MASQLVGGHIDSSVNNPIEAVAQWRAGELRPLCVFDTERMPYKEPIAEGKSWADIPTCRESGLDIDYLMLRGIFTTRAASSEQVAFYVSLLEKVRATPEWQELAARGAFKNSFKTGPELEQWLAAASDRHKSLMEKAGFLAQ